MTETPHSNELKSDKPDAIVIVGLHQEGATSHLSEPTAPPHASITTIDSHRFSKYMKQHRSLAVLAVVASGPEDASVASIAYVRQRMRDDTVRIVLLTDDETLADAELTKGTVNACRPWSACTPHDLTRLLTGELQTHRHIRSLIARKTAQVDLLCSLSRLAQHDLDIEECLAAYAKAIQGASGSYHCQLVAIDSQGTALASESHAEATADFAVPCPGQADGGLDLMSCVNRSFRQATEERSTQICLDRDDHTHISASSTLGVPIEGSVAIPIQCHDNCIAVIQCFFRADDLEKLSVEVIRTLEKAAQQLGILLERREAERQIARRNSRLQRTLADLKDAQQRLVHAEKMASLGQLSAGIAHEINNPIAFVKSNLESLHSYVNSMLQLVSKQDEAINSLAAIDDSRVESARRSMDALKREIDFELIQEDTASLVADSQDGVERVADIVRNLRAFSHVDTEHATLFDVEAGIESTLRMLAGATKHGVEVKRHYAPLPRVACNGGQINQVFMNILANAVDALDGTGEIEITTSATESEVRISIADNGPGIDAAHIDQIFDPFFTTKAVGAGTGLGLSISYGIMKEHRGRIEVESTPGHGTRLVVVLPRSDHEQLAVEPVSPAVAA